MGNYLISSTFLLPLFLCLSFYCMKAMKETNQVVNANNNAKSNRWRRKVSTIILNRWSPLNMYNDIPTEEQLLEWDAQRARSIQTQFRAGRDEIEKNGPIKLPAIPGAQINSSSFVVYAKIGKSAENQILIFDTGSQLTWVQCASCKRAKCFPQKTKTYFDPIASGSSKIECSSGVCGMLKGFHTSSCKKKANQCGFSVSYVDGSTVSGDIFKDKLILENQVVSDRYIFGCVNNFQDPGKTFRGSSGIMGLHRGTAVSIVDQTAQNFGDTFSYCLPSGMLNFGHLTFGPSLNKARFEATIPIKEGKGSEYIVALVGLTVGKKRLNISPTIFSEGALIDTGSVKTWLPQSAYDTLKTEFIIQMKDYSRNHDPKNPSAVCYDLTKYPRSKELPIPKITLHFKANRNEQKFQLSDTGVMGGKWENRCLAFAPNESKDDKLSIIGGYAQQTFNFVFDLKKNTILVGPNGCK